MVLFHYEKVYNFDIAGNENYYVTEDGILVHNGYKETETPVKEFEVMNYQKFLDKSRIGDELQGHEVLQHAWLKIKGLVQDRKSPINLKNPVIALSDALHKKVNKLQRNIDFSNQTALENIEANIKLLKEIDEIPMDRINEIEKITKEFIKTLNL